MFKYTNKFLNFSELVQLLFNVITYSFDTYVTRIIFKCILFNATITILFIFIHLSQHILIRIQYLFSNIYTYVLCRQPNLLPLTLFLCCDIPYNFQQDYQPVNICFLSIILLSSYRNLNVHHCIYTLQHSLECLCNE